MGWFPPTSKIMAEKSFIAQSQGTNPIRRYGVIDA